MKMFRNLSIFVLTFLSILVVGLYGCQKEVAQVSPKVEGSTDLQVETRGLGDFVNVVNYNLYPTWTIGQYWKKARKGNLFQSDINFASYAKYNNYKISDINNYQFGNGFGTGMAAKIKKDDFDFFIKSVCNYLGGIGDSGFVSRKKALLYDLKYKMNLQRVPNPQ